MIPTPLSLGSYKRSGLPEAATVNCFAESTPTKNGFSLLARPGLESFETVGTAPIRCIFQKQGTFSNSALVVSKDTIYTLTSTAVATAQAGPLLTGSDLVDIDAGLDADGESLARFVADGALYTLTGGVVTAESLSSVGGSTASSVQYYKGYWLIVIDGILYYIIPGATALNALQFAAADYAPDALKGVRVFGELFAMLGERSTEFWRATGDATSPLEPYGGLNFDFGCRNIHAAKNCQGTLIWPDENGSVWSCSGGEPKLISDSGLAEQIRGVDADDLHASFYIKDQHPFYVLTLGSRATWIYDLATSLWHRADSLGYDYWRAHLHCNIGDLALAADALSAQVWRLDPDRRTDGSDTFTVVGTAYLMVQDGALPVDNFQLDCRTGESPLSGQGSDPLIVLQTSRDGTRTWGPEKERGLGATGDYTKRVRWTGLGEARAPHGMWFRWYVSDPVGRRFSGAMVNAR